MESGRESGIVSRQDCTQFEDALRRLYALERKLTDQADTVGQETPHRTQPSPRNIQVQVDIRELRQKWVLPRVERVTTNTFKLYQVREQLKLNKVLFVEEERILEEFKKVKLQMKENSSMMDDEEFDATKETCMVLGGKLMETRAKQHRCYSDNEDLEIVINREIMAIRFEDKDFRELDLESVRASTPLRKLSPTPLDRHKSREPSPFIMPRLKLGSGTITPSGSRPADPHTYFSRSSSSQSLHHGGFGGSQTFQGGIGNLDFDSFRAAMEAKQAEEENGDQTITTTVATTASHTQSMTNISSWKTSTIGQNREPEHLLCPGGMFSMERPSSAMSEVSIHMADHMDLPSRADSRMETFPLGDAISHGHLAYSEDQQSNLSSRRGSELHSLGMKDNKTSTMSSWYDKLEAETSFASDIDPEIDEYSNVTSLQVPSGESRKEEFSNANSLKKDISESAVQLEQNNTPQSEKQSKANQAKTVSETENKSGDAPDKNNKGTGYQKINNKSSKVEDSKGETQSEVETRPSSGKLTKKGNLEENKKIKSEKQPVADTSKVKNKTEQGDSSTPSLSIDKTDSKPESRSQSRQRGKIPEDITREDTDGKKEVVTKVAEEPKQFSNLSRGKQSAKVEEDMSEESGSRTTAKPETGLNPRQSSKDMDKSSRPTIQGKQPTAQVEENITEMEPRPSSRKAANKEVEKPLSRPASKKESLKEPVEDYMTEVEPRPSSRKASNKEVDKPISRPASRGKKSTSQVEEDVAGVESRPNSQKTANKEVEKPLSRPASKQEPSKEPVEDYMTEVEPRPSSRKSTKKDEEKILSRPNSRAAKVEEDLTEVEPRPSSRKSTKKEEEKILSRPNSRAAKVEEDLTEVEPRPSSRKSASKDVEKPFSRPASRKEPDNEQEEEYKTEVEPMPSSRKDATKEIDKPSSRPASRGKPANEPVEEDITEVEPRPISRKASNKEEEKPLSRPNSRGKHPAAKVEEDLTEVEPRPSSRKTVSKDIEKPFERPASRKEPENEPVEVDISEVEARPWNRKSLDKPSSRTGSRNSGQIEPEGGTELSRPDSKHENQSQISSRNRKTSLNKGESSEVEDQPRPSSRGKRTPEAKYCKEDLELTMANIETVSLQEEDEPIQQRPVSQGRKTPSSIEEMKKQTLTIIQDNLEPSTDNQKPQSRSGSRNGGTQLNLEKEHQDTIESVKHSRPSSRTSKIPTPLEELKEQSLSLLEDTIGKSPEVARQRTFSAASSSGFEQTEPAEWVDNEDEDELMIILDTDQYGLEDVEEEDEPTQHAKHPLEFSNLPGSSVDAEALEQLERQYEEEFGQSSKPHSRPSSGQERPVSILKGSREPSGERIVDQEDKGSRPASKSSFRERHRQGFVEKKKISFDDDFPPDDQSNKIEDCNIEKSRSQSRERPGSRSSQGSFRGKTDRERKKSSSQVPELETIEIPSSLKEKLEQIEQTEPVYKGSERQDSPRPPSRPSSTGFTHLDEFERKLAEMETELEEESTKKALDEGEETNLVKRENMWNLCEKGQDGRETYDGYFVNQEQELDNLDHSFIVAGGPTDEETLDLRSKKVSFAASDERYEIQRPGQVKTLGKNLYSLSPPKPMKKLPSKTQHSTESSAEETPTLDSKKLSSKETSPFTSDRDSNKGFFSSLRRSVSRSKTPDTEREGESFFGSLLRKGKRGSKSASRQSSVDRDSQDLGSELEGRLSRASDAGSETSLVLKLRKLAKKKPKQVSTTDFDELFARGMAMSSGLDPEDEPDTANRRTERKKAITDGIDYNEKVQAFLVDQAKNTQIMDDIRRDKSKKSSTSSVPKSESRSQSRQERKPIKIHIPSQDDDVAIITERKISDYAKPQEIKLSPQTPKRDIFTGEVLPQSPDEEFLARITDFVSNYSKNTYEQVWPSSPSKSKERFNNKISSTHTKNTKSNSIKSENITYNTSSTDSKEIIQTEPIVVHQDRESEVEDITKEFHPTDVDDVEKAKEATPPAIPPEETEFLNRVSSFVTQYSNSEEYSQKIWPSSPKKSAKSDKRKKTMSPGKSFIDNDTGNTQWFGRSIEADSYEAQIQVEELDKRKKSTDKVVKNNLSAGAALMRQHLSSAGSKEPSVTEDLSPPTPISPPPRANKRNSKSETPLEFSPLPEKRQDQSSGLSSRNSESRFTNEEFFTKLVVGLQKFATPEPEVRKSMQPFSGKMYKAQSESFIKPQMTATPKPQETVRAGSVTESPRVEVKPKVTQSMTELKTGEDKNKEFYNKLVSGLKDMTASQSLSPNMKSSREEQSLTTPNMKTSREEPSLTSTMKAPSQDQAQTNADEDIYRKYSHHLGRAEFGTLRRRESTGSNVSVIRSPQQPKGGQEASYDQISSKLSLNRKLSRQDSDEKRMKRGQSKMSDASEAMPDLEIDDEIESEMLMRIEGNRANRSITPDAGRVSTLEPANTSSNMLQIPLPEVRKTEALQNVSEQKQKIRAVKERVQNGLMTVVGMGVMAYLTTLDSMGGTS